MNVLIAGKTSEICDSIAGLLIDLDCDNISTFTSGAIVRGVDISRFDSVIISTPLSDEFGLDLVADIAKDAKSGVVVLAKHEIADEVQKKIRFTAVCMLTDVQLLRTFSAQMIPRRYRKLSLTGQSLTK